MVFTFKEATRTALQNLQSFPIHIS